MNLTGLDSMCKVSWLVGVNFGCRANMNVNEDYCCMRVSLMEGMIIFHHVYL